jgi:hypothetical protein
MPVKMSGSVRMVIMVIVWLLFFPYRNIFPYKSSGYLSYGYYGYYGYYFYISKSIL